MKFKELFTGRINEGTQASISVLMPDGTVRSSILRYDGSEDASGELLKKMYNSQDKAEKLVQGTGELRSIYGGRPDYYEDRTLLKKYNSYELYQRNASLQTSYNYYWDGSHWLLSMTSVRKMKRF